MSAGSKSTARIEADDNFIRSGRIIKPAGIDNQTVGQMNGLIVFFPVFRPVFFMNFSKAQIAGSQIKKARKIPDFITDHDFEIFQRDKSFWGIIVKLGCK